MLDRIPYLHQFSQLYWHQMGDEIYGTIDRAFRHYLADASRLPDAGKSLRRGLYSELMLILDSTAYEDWVKLSRSNVEAVRAVGGRFIFPEDVRPLMAILDETFTPDA